MSNLKINARQGCNCIDSQAFELEAMGCRVVRVTGEDGTRQLDVSVPDEQLESVSRWLDERNATDVKPTGWEVGD